MSVFQGPILIGPFDPFHAHNLGVFGIGPREDIHGIDESPVVQQEFHRVFRLVFPGSGVSEHAKKVHLDVGSVA